MAISRWVRTHWAALALGAIVLASASLSLTWVFLVPIYESPDEHTHLDYALCIKDHGGLFRAEPLAPGEVPGYVVHPLTDLRQLRPGF